MASESELTHLDESGQMRMVDVAAKEPSSRTAVAEAELAMIPKNTVKVEGKSVVRQFLRRGGRGAMLRFGAGVGNHVPGGFTGAGRPADP